MKVEILTRHLSLQTTYRVSLLISFEDGI